MAWKGTNPLLKRLDAPPFDRIRTEQVVPAAHELVDTLHAELDALETSGQSTWKGLVEPIEDMIDRLHSMWGTVAHLVSVRNSDTLRQAHEQVQGDVVALDLRLRQSRSLYDGLKELRTGPGWSTLDGCQRRIVNCMVRNAELGGVGLEGEARARFAAIEQRLAELGTRFSNNVLDSTKAGGLVLRRKSDVAGLPESVLERAAGAARDARDGEATAADGPWRFSLDASSFLPFMEHCRHRKLRERLYRAYVTRASEGEHDNTPVLGEILRLRDEQSRLLGYASYAELSIASKMAPSVESVERLMEELLVAAAEPARDELERLREVAVAQGGEAAGELAHWDLPFWWERLRERDYGLKDEELRPYFPLPHVLDGLFKLCRKLFGIRIERLYGAVPVWHEDVAYYRVRDERGRMLAAFYLDPYSRPAEKREGAWMHAALGRSRRFAPPGRQARLPVAYLVCNQAPPMGEEPSLMTFDDVRTLFHEFGHALQHMLTTVDYGLAAGIQNIEWDGVEVASQFMENWCYHAPTLRSLGRHYRTGQKLPLDVTEAIVATRTFRAASHMMRQLHFGMTDLALHHRYDPYSEQEPLEVSREVARRSALLPPLPEERTLCSFAHIFAGGYAAGYYSYKWAEVMSADAFGAFEDAGLDDADAMALVGRRYRDTILALGGSVDPLEAFSRFRGRLPTTDALLRNCGLGGMAA